MPIKEHRTNLICRFCGYRIAYVKHRWLKIDNISDLFAYPPAWCPPGLDGEHRPVED